MNLLPLLVQKNVIRAEDVAAFEEAAASGEKTLEQVLVESNVDPNAILEAKGDHFEIPTRRVKEEEVKHEILRYIPEESAMHYKFAPLSVKDGVLEIGIVDPDNLDALDALNFISAKVNMPFKVFLILETDFLMILKTYKGLSGEVGKALDELDSELTLDTMLAPAEADEAEKGELGEVTVQEDAPVTKIVATILRYAVEGRASDIHIEPTATQVRIRFRLDGMLSTSLVLPVAVLQSVVARIKILSSMRLDEKRKPQDGRFSATIEGRKIDFRVSTLPSYHGEKVVMRILDRGKQDITNLEALGFSPEGIATIQRAVQQPYGMILISGPTGSGKSTTLYGMLNEVDRDTKNVVSLEDPVEYDIPGMNQSQVRPEIGYTFASGLRSILRQDPDVIMVGEIRDKETAQLAVQAALTGHLVFSTIHTNNSVGVVPRLVDMGVDPYLIAPTLVLAMAQRLVRRLCPDTGREIPIEGSIKVMVEKEFELLPEASRKKIPQLTTLYGIEPGPDCPTGTRGRIGVFEFLEVNKKIEQIILSGGGEKEIEQAARTNGMLTMKQDAIIKALEKLIPFEEINTLGGELMADEEASEPIPEHESDAPPETTIEVESD